MKMEQLKSRIEAVLFITARAVSLEEIAVILGEEKERAFREEFRNQLKERYKVSKVFFVVISVMADSNLIYSKVFIDDVPKLISKENEAIKTRTAHNESPLFL